MTQDPSMKNTKVELLDIIDKMQQEIADKEKTMLKPEKLKKQVKAREVVEQTEQITKTDVSTQIHNLKMTVVDELSDLAEKIQSKAKKYTLIQEAIELKQAELEEIYGIEKHAATLAAILESNNRVKEEFDEEMRMKQEELEQQISETRAAWAVEKKNYQADLAEEKKKTEKDHKREEDEYSYNLQRTRAIEENEYTDKISTLEKEIADKKEKLDKQVEDTTALLDDREKVVAKREEAMGTLEESVSNFPTDLEKAITIAVEQKENELNMFFNQEKALLTKGLEGEQKVLEAKISAMESLVKDQANQIDQLTTQQERAYKHVQDIAEKAVAGASERPQAITIKTSERDA